MLKIFLLLIIFAQTAFSASLSIDDRRKKILSIVDEELSEVSRLAKQQNYKSPDTLLRLSELNLEKARLYREVENERYLSIPFEERRDTKKDDYFKTSSKFFEAANDSALVVVTRFPKYRVIGDVYFIIAFNNKELGNHESAKKYFELASKNSTSSNEINLKSKLNLADYYFNEHKYKEAIPLYEAAIKKLVGNWWTKDAFNLAWSYYRVKSYDKAIGLMKEVHKRSGDKKYINMKDLVERDIGVFFIDAGKMNEAIKFYEDLGLDYTQQFVKIANTIITQGRFAQAESLLAQAEKNEKDLNKRVEILIAELNLFDKFDKIPSHLKVAKELVRINGKNPLKKEQLDRLIFHVNKKAAELQKSTASEIYQNVPKTKRIKSKQAIAYFELSAQLTPGLKSEKTFFQGETAYAADDYGTALKFYLSSFDSAQQSKDKKIISQSLDGMLSSLGQKSLSPAVADIYYIPVYTRYLSMDTKSAKASSIYQKLFNAQIEKNEINNAEKTLAGFAQNFPNDFKTQEGMLAKVMDYYRKKKDYGAVKSYVSRINSGEFKVSSKYAEALRSLMTKIQIEGVQQSLERGEKGAALKGYHQIYDSSESTAKAKTNAAYNLSALYYELGDTKESYQWSVSSLKDMDNNDIIKFADSFLSIASGLFLRQQFAQSADLSYRMLLKICSENSSNKAIAYKNAVYISLANNDLDKAIEIRNYGKNCSISNDILAEVSFEILKDLGSAGRWELFEKMLVELDKNPKNFPQLIKPYEELRKQYLKIGSNEEAREISVKQNNFFQQSKSQKLDIPVEALDLMAERMQSNILEKKQRLEKITLSFPESQFNQAVKAKLQLLDQMTSDVNTIQKLGSGKGIVDAYQHVIEAYQSFGNALKEFTPPGKEEAYVTSFKKAMADVHVPILNNANKQRSEIKKLVVENKILSLSNYTVLYSDDESFKRYLTEKEAVLMERGGQR